MRLPQRCCLGTEITEKVVWHVVKEYAKQLGVSKLAPHDLRRSCARLCHESGGELEQIQFLLGHVSVQTTEKYLARKIRDFISTKGLAMVQIRCLRGFETKSEAF